MDPLSQLRNSDLQSQCRHATMSHFDLHPPTTEGVSQYSESTRQQQFHYSIPGSSSLQAYYLQSRDLPRATEAPWHMQDCSSVRSLQPCNEPLGPGVEKGPFQICITTALRIKCTFLQTVTGMTYDAFTRKYLSSNGGLRATSKW